MAVFALSIFSLYSLPVAHAWGVSDMMGAVAGIFQQGEDVESVAPVMQKNSQNMTLAEAPLNHDLNQKNIGDNAEVVDDSALSAGLDPTPGKDDSLTVSTDRISTYVVHEGDTLSQIAKMFGVSTNTILWANDIPRGGSIKIGQQLVILPVSGIQYTVKKGDTVAKLAKRYNSDAEEIKAFNGVDEEGLTVGDVIVIPNGVESLTPPPTTSLAQKVINKITQAFNGYLIRPVPGVRTQGLHGHNAVDFHASVGTSIVAAASGVVQVSRSGGYNGGYGSYVVIQHPNGMQTLYAHMSQVFVAGGTTVSQGQTIGLSGNTGKSTGPHLHFEVRGGVNPF